MPSVTGFLCLVMQKHAGSLLEGFTQTQISTLAVKDNFLVAGGFQGELTCKVSAYLLILSSFSHAGFRYSLGP